MIKDILDKYIDKIKKNYRILDTGCGTGALMKEINNHHGVVFGVDVSEKAINFCKKRGIGNLQIGSITNIPFADSSFDVVLDLDVLEHVKNDEQGILEIKRVLKKDGIAVFFVPAFMFLWGKADELGEHFRRYTLSGLTEKIKKSELFMVRSSYFNTFLFLPILFVRFIVRIFKIKIDSENNMGSNFINEILYVIFYIESLLLRLINFPFGVSIEVICKKI